MRLTKMIEFYDFVVVDTDYNDYRDSDLDLD